MPITINTALAQATVEVDEEHEYVVEATGSNAGANWTAVWKYKAPDTATARVMCRSKLIRGGIFRRRRNARGKRSRVAGRILTFPSGAEVVLDSDPNSTRQFQRRASLLSAGLFGTGSPAWALHALGFGSDRHLG